MKESKDNFLPGRQYPAKLSAPQDIDLIELFLLLWNNLTIIIIGIFVGTILGLLVSRFSNVVKSSEARIIPPLFQELQGQQSLQEKLSALDVSVPLGSDTWFILFIQAYDSSSLQEEWLKKSKFSHQKVNFSRQSSSADKKHIFDGYRYENLTVSGGEGFNAKVALDDYMKYVSQSVNKDISLRVQQIIRQQLVEKKHSTKDISIQLPEFYVQPYRIQERPTKTESSPPHIIIFMLAGGFLGGVVICLYIIMSDAVRKSIMNRTRN